MGAKEINEWYPRDAELNQILHEIMRVGITQLRNEERVQQRTANCAL